MFITISPQKLESTYTSSVSDYVAYLEKENEDRDLQEHFFSQSEDNVPTEKVINDIDKNTAKLKKKEPRFYSIIVSPSWRELKHIENDPEALKKYTRALMKQYAKAFHRDREVTVDDILYYAKIEHERTFRGYEKQILENAPFRKRIAKLENDIRKIERGELNGQVKLLQKEIDHLKVKAPHKRDGKLIAVGMKKEGLQTHVHIIVSRKDKTNTYSLSPGSRYRASATEFNGKHIKRGFNRKNFFEAAEKTFDKSFNYNRNYVETFQARNAFIKNPKWFYARLAGLPIGQRTLAFKLLSKTGLQASMIPTNKAQLALAAFRKLKRGVKIAMQSGSIGV